MKDLLIDTVVKTKQLQWLKTYVRTFALNGRFLHVSLVAQISFISKTT